MIVTINKTDSEVLGYATIGGIVDTDDSENYSFEWSGVKPEPPHEFEAYDSDGWKIRKKTEADINTDKAIQKWIAIRAKRKDLLNKSDGMYLRQLEDNTLDDYHFNLLKQYRQDLRNITEQTNPFAITWPTWPL